VFNQFGDLERSALRPGNLHSADGWDRVLKPVVTRYQGKVSRIYFRADAAFGPPFRLREVSIAVRTLRLSCRKAGKAPIFTPVRESSGESRIKGIVD
jgi:hypothetical protein